MLTLLYYLLRKIAPQSGWPGRLEGLLNRHPHIPLEKMGFVDDWKNHPLWNLGETNHDRYKRRESENRKLDCGKAHFKALDVNFKVATNIAEILAK